MPLFFVFYNLEFEPDLLAANDRTQIMLPKFPCETHCGPLLIKIYEDLKAEESPKVQRCDVTRNWAHPHIGIEIKIAPVLDKGIERVRVYVIAMCWITWPVRVRVMRREQLDTPAGPCDPMQFGHEGH